MKKQTFGIHFFMCLFWFSAGASGEKSKQKPLSCRVPGGSSSPAGCLNWTFYFRLLVSVSEVPGDESFSGFLAVTNETRGQKTFDWLTADAFWSSFFFFFFDVVTFWCVSAVRTTSQIAANVCQRQPSVCGVRPVFLCFPSSHSPAHTVTVPKPTYHALQPTLQR